MRAGFTDVFVTGMPMRWMSVSAEADGDSARSPPARACRRAEDDDQEEERHHDSVSERAACSEYPPGECSPKPFAAKPPAEVEAGLPARDDVEHAGPRCRPRPARRCSRGSPPGSAPRHEAHGHRRIQVTAGDVTDGVRHRQHREPERRAKRRGARSRPWETRRENGAAAASEHQPERAGLDSASAFFPIAGLPLEEPQL